MSRISDRLQVSGKHALINKANSRMVIAVSVTVAVVIFSFVASRSLIDKLTYQNKVIGLRQEALKTLESNVKAANDLNDAYIKFDSAAESVIGTKDKNSKIVLDALPSKYDYPALTTTISEIVKNSSNTLGSISGTDNEAEALQDSLNPKPVPIKIDITASGNYETIQRLINDLQRSIRPMKILSISFSGRNEAMQVQISLETYYQPKKKIDFEQKVVPGGNKSSSKSSSTSTTSSNSSTSTTKETN